MREEKALDIVEDLNQNLYELFGNSDYYFEFGSTGNSEYIAFSGMTLWTSENEERGWRDDVDEIEDLREFLLKKLNNISLDLEKFTSKG